MRPIFSERPLPARLGIKYPIISREFKKRLSGGCGMHIPRKIKIIIRHQLRRSKWFRCWNGERLLKRTFKELFKKDLNLKALNTFSEKLFSRMIMVNRNGNAAFTRLADKHLVRDYVREKIGDEYLVKSIWQGTNPFDIPFDRLPKKYVIKTNHGSKYNIVVDGEGNRKKIIENLQAWLKQNFYWNSHEYHYFSIFPRVLVEEFIDDGELDGPLSYLFWCFDGVPEIIQVSNRTQSIHAFYDTSWNKLDLRYREPSVIRDIEKPKHFARMLTVAAKLSKDFDFVRVDLYNANGQIVFGELTFTPRAGRILFIPESWDLKLGQKWRIR
jgi:hypothetical protein